MSVVLNLFVALMLPGMIVRTRALLAGRKGAPFYQHISRLGALLCKAPVYSPATGFVFRLAPVVYLATDSDLGVVERYRSAIFPPYSRSMETSFCFAICWRWGA